jgi:hypothetical protein
MPAINSLRWFKPVQLNKYPHFNLTDSRIWDSFLKVNPTLSLRFAYDVPLIDESQTPPSLDKNLSHDWNYLTAFKVDVIGERAAGLDLYEVKPLLTLQAIGQVMSYIVLFNKFYNNLQATTLNIVCTHADPQLAYVCKFYHINLFEIITEDCNIEIFKNSLTNTRPFGRKNPDCCE